MILMCTMVTSFDHGPRVRKIYACIDTGCFWTRQGDGCGMLTALQYPEMIFYEHENIDTKMGGDEPKKGKLTLEDVKARKKKHRVNC